MSATAIRRQAHPGGDALVRPGDARFAWGMVLVNCWFVGGLFLDAWAHIHLPDLETFFTPWHGVLYSGFVALVAYVAAAVLRRHAAGRPWSAALPAGYGVAPLGIAVFAVAGVGDVLWHELFGVEANLEAAVSPTHLLLFTGMTLLLLGPLRSPWTPGGPALDRVPALLATAFLVTLFSTVTAYANPLTRVLASGTTDLELGLIGVAWYAFVLMGPLLLLMRGGRVPIGGVTLVFGVHALLQGAIDDALQFVPGAVLAGLAVDALRWAINRGGDRARAPHAVALAAPGLYFGAYFLTLGLTRGVAWSVHLWVGAIALGALTSLWLSLLVGGAERAAGPSRAA